MSIQGYPIVQLPGYEIQGFALTYVTSTTITVGLGTAWDSNNRMQIVLGSETVVGAVTAAPYTINAAAAGAGGLDAGTFSADVTYYVHVIASSFNNALPAALISLSATAPLLPSNYDSFRMIGALQTGATAIFRPFDAVRAGSLLTVQYRTPILLAAGTSTTSATISLVEVTSLCPAVPAVGLFKSNLEVYYTPTTAGNVLSIKGYDGAAVTTTNGQYNFTGIVSAQVQNHPISLITPSLTGVPSVTYLIGTAGTQTIHVVGYDMAL